MTLPARARGVTEESGALPLACAWIDLPQEWGTATKEMGRAEPSLFIAATFTPFCRWCVGSNVVRKSADGFDS
jgi:hypothetical protein